MWVYTLGPPAAMRSFGRGGPFQMVGWYQPQIASCVLVLWTLIVPLFIEPPMGKPAQA